MKPEVGKSYIAVSADGDIEGYWVFYIVAEVKQAAATFYIGLMNKPSNMTAHLFTTEGRSIDTSDYALGFVLTSTSRQRPKWSIAKCVGSKA